MVWQTGQKGSAGRRLSEGVCLGVAACRGDDWRGREWPREGNVSIMGGLGACADSSGGGGKSGVKGSDDV